MPFIAVFPMLFYGCRKVSEIPVICIEKISFFQVHRILPPSQQYPAALWISSTGGEYAAGELLLILCTLFALPHASLTLHSSLFALCSIPHGFLMASSCVPRQFLDSSRS